MIISAHKIREIMGKAGEKYTDSQLEEVVNALTVLADLVIDNYLLRQKINKKDNSAEKNLFPIYQTNTKEFRVNLNGAK